MSIRQDIAEALSTVPGVSGHLSQPAAPSPGQAWPLWVRTTYISSACKPHPDESDWEVVLLLPALDPHSGDLLRDEVATALGTAGTVLAAEPSEFTVQPDGQSAPSIRYEVTITEGTPF